MGVGGVRLGFKSKAYIITENQGLLFRLQNGKTFLVGSQEPKKFEAVVISARHTVSNNYHHITKNEITTFIVRNIIIRLTTQAVTEFYRILC